MLVHSFVLLLFLIFCSHIHELHKSLAKRELSNKPKTSSVEAQSSDLVKILFSCEWNIGFLRYKTGILIPALAGLLSAYKNFLEMQNERCVMVIEPDKK
jgi:hypothetical protein